MPGRSKTPFQRVLLAGILPLFTAHGHLTIVDDFVRSIHDWHDDAHVLDQPDAAKQLALPASHADFAGKLCFAHTSAGVNWYQSNRAAATWNSLHNGAGDQPVLISTPTGTGRPFGTRSTGAGPIGLVQSHDGAPNLSVFCGNGVGNASLSPGAGGATSGTPTFSRVQVGASTSRLWSKGTQITSTSFTPSASDCVGTLIYGAQVTGSSPVNMRSPAFLIWPAAAPVEPLHAWILHDYGIAA